MPNIKSLIGGGYGISIIGAGGGGPATAGGGAVSAGPGGGGVGVSNLIEVTGLAVSETVTVTVGRGTSSFGAQWSAMGGGGAGSAASEGEVKMCTTPGWGPKGSEYVNVILERAYDDEISPGLFSFTIAERILFRRGADTEQGIELIFADCKKLARFRHVDHVQQKHTWTLRDGSKILFYEKDQTIKTLRY